MTRYGHLDSPVGRLLVVGAAEGLRAIWFDTERCPVPASDWVEAPAAFSDLATQLEEYFSGTRRAFDLALAPVGTTFQHRVWNELRQIPFGVTRSYGELAHRLGSPAASRAVGLANGRNPLSIVVPCHRVIGSDGSLTGFGGGLERKRFLLELEGCAVAERRQGKLFA